MRRKLKVWDFLLLLFMCLVLTMTKPVYAFLCLIVFWIPKERFKSIKCKLGWIFLLGGITLGMVLLRMVLMPLGVDLVGAADDQMNIVLQSPFGVLGMTFKTTTMLLSGYIGEIIGSRLEIFSLDILAPYVLVFFVAFVLLCAERRIAIARSLRIFAGVALAVTIIMISVSEFIIWTEPNAELISGVQGRYFLPVLLLVPLMCLPSKESKGKLNKTELIKPAYLYTFATLASVYVLAVAVAVHI